MIRLAILGVCLSSPGLIWGGYYLWDAVRSER